MAWLWARLFLRAVSLDYHKARRRRTPEERRRRIPVDYGRRALVFSQPLRGVPVRLILDPPWPFVVDQWPSLQSSRRGGRALEACAIDEFAAVL